MKRESKRLVRKTSVMGKLPSFLCLWLLLSTFAPILPHTVFAETEKVVTTDSSALKTIQSDVVENELPNYNQSSEIREENGASSSEETETSTSMVPENTALETTVAEKKEQKNRGLIRNAEAKITVVDTGIVLKNDGTYLLMDNPEDYAGGIHRPEDVKGTGQYDEQTIVEFANTQEYGLNRLYSEKNSSGSGNTIQQITIAAGTYSELTILSDSVLTVQTDLDCGIHVDRLIIGELEELVWNPVLLTVRAAKLGIYTPAGTKNVTGNVDTSGSQAGISMTKETPPIREDFTALAQFYEDLDQEDAASSMYEALSGTKMQAQGTSANGCGAVFATYQLRGTELTGIADGTGYGIFAKDEGTLESISDAHGQETERFFEGKLNGSSAAGIGVFVDGYLTNYGGIIRGTSTTATGVEAGYYASDAVSYNGVNYLSEMKGTVQAGFGILMRSVSVYDGTTYMDPGEMQLDSGKVAGYAADGTGVFAGSFRIGGTQEVDLSGESDKGQGIVAADVVVSTYPTPKPKVAVTGSSLGESTETMSVLLELLSISTGATLTDLPTSAGVICLREFSDQGNDLTLKAKAPTAIAGSYGFYGLDGTESGINIMAENEVDIEAVGDCGIQTANLEVMVSNELTNTAGLLSIDVNAKATGIRTNKTFKATAPNASTVDGGSKIAVTASEGDGIVTSTGAELNFIGGYGEENTFKIPVTITAKETAMKSEFTTSNWSPEGITLAGIALSIVGVQEGIKASGLDSYNFSSSVLSINTKKNGIKLTGGDSSGSVMFDGTSMDIVSGEYGIYLAKAYVDISSGYSGGAKQIEVTAEHYPFWIDGETTISNYEKYDGSTGSSYYDQLSIIVNSKGIQPDQRAYPAFYVKDHLVSIDGYAEKIQLIENYQKAVSIPFNATPSVPYAIAANFNIEEYAHYEWKALRTDNNTALVINQSQIDQNKLFTLDTTYDEAKLTAKRTNHTNGERIFNDEDNVMNQGQILHEINMLVRREEQYSVTYDPNGADAGTTPTDSNLYSQGDTVNVAPQGDLLKNDHSFVGWLNNVDNQIYQNPFLSSSPTTYTMGQEDVTFTAQWQSNSIVEELSLLTSKIPDKLNFGTHQIENGTVKTYYATDSGSDNENASASDLTTGAVGVEDTRLSSEGWSLTVKQLTQFQTVANQELTGAELSFYVGQPDLSQSTGGAPMGVSNQKVTLTPSFSSQLLTASGGQGKGIVELPIDKFILEIPGTADKYASDYTTQVEWLVSNVP